MDEMRIRIKELEARFASEVEYNRNVGEEYEESKDELHITKENNNQENGVGM